MSWSDGDTVIVRYIARSDGSVASAIPTIAIQDDTDVLALFTAPGTVFKDNYVVPPDERAEAARQIRPSKERQHRNRTWLLPTIRLYLPEQAFSVWLFFGANGDFMSWYGNLESPYVRTALGIDTRDHALDIVADRERRWSWKDEAEFAQRLASGIDTETHQEAVRAAGREFISRLEGHKYPFDQEWPSWRAPSDWTPRSLPPNWDADWGTGAVLR